MPFCRLYIIVTYRNGRGFAETGKKVKKKNLHEREENGGQHVARSGRQALGREKTGKTDCCGQRHHGASLTRSPGRQYLRLNHCMTLPRNRILPKSSRLRIVASMYFSSRTGSGRAPWAIRPWQPVERPRSGGRGNHAKMVEITRTGGRRFVESGGNGVFRQRAVSTARRRRVRHASRRRHDGATARYG